MKSVRGDVGIQGEKQYAECGGKLKRSKASYMEMGADKFSSFCMELYMHNHGKKVIKKKCLSNKLSKVLMFTI